MNTQNNSGFEFIQKNIVSILIFCGAIYGVWYSYTKQIEKENGLIATIQLERDKNEVLKRILSLENVFLDAGKKINKKDITEIPNLINNLAQQVGVNVLNTNKKEEESFDLYKRIPYELKVSALNYHSLAKFVNLLESSPDIYTVETLNIKKLEIMPENNVLFNPNMDLQQKTSSNTESVTAIIEVSTIELNTKL